MELYRRYRAAQGRKKKATLDGYCEVFVMSDEVSDSKDTHKNLLEAQVNVEEWKQKYENLEEEIYELYVSMAEEVNAHEMDKEEVFSSRFYTLCLTFRCVQNCSQSLQQ